MSAAVILDKETGRPEAPSILLGPSGLPRHVEENFEKGWQQPQYSDIKPDYSSLPQHIIDNLEKARKADFSKSSPFLAISQGWRQMEGVILADTSLTAAAEAIMCPDFLLAIPRPGLRTPGISYKFTLIGSQSLAATTPGTLTWRLRWGGVAGVLLVTSAAVTGGTDAAAKTTASFILEYWVTIRTEPTPTTATAWAQGRMQIPGILDPAANVAAVVTALKNEQIPTTAAAVSPSIDVSTAKALSPTYQPSLGTATMATHLAYVESFN